MKIIRGRFPVQAFAFLYREHCSAKRGWSWIFVFSVYAVINSVSIGLIGLYIGDVQLTSILLLGSILWAYMSVLFKELPMSIAAERWEGTLEYTMMAPIGRSWHLIQVGIYMSFLAVMRVVFILLFLPLFFHFSWSATVIETLLLTLLASTPAFIGVGILAASLPLLNPDRGAEAANVINGLLLLISGIFYPVTVLPHWLQRLSILSPATYAINILRTKTGAVSLPGSAGRMVSLSTGSISHDLSRLLVSGPLYLCLGVAVFHWTEHCARRRGTLSRSG